MASRGRGGAKLSILMFHRVLPKQDAVFPGDPFAASFEALLRHVARRFRVMSFSEAIDKRQRGKLPSRALSITFDDGYADNLTVAAPLLSKMGLPATVFVASNYLDQGCMFNDLVVHAVRETRAAVLDLRTEGLGSHDLGSPGQRRQAIEALLGAIKYLEPAERTARAEAVLAAAHVSPPTGLMLTRDEVRELKQWGMEVGAHTLSHPILARLDSAQAWDEISGSKRVLEGILGHPVRWFAYPNGRPGRDYNAEHVDMVRKAGFAAAVTTAPGAATRHSDPFQLPRFTPWHPPSLRFDLLMARNLWQGERADMRASASSARNVYDS